MIAIEPSRTAAATAEDEERLGRSLRRARWMTLAAVALALIAWGAGSSPIGLFLPLVVLFGFFFPFWALPWTFATVHAWVAWRRGAPSGGRRLMAWMVPAVLLSIAVALALGPWPAHLATTWARGSLDRLRSEAAALPAHQVRLPDRWIGIWPVEGIVRYAGGELRMDLLGGRIGSRLRGLAFDPDGPPLPGSWQPARWRELSGGWHAWER